LGLVRALQIPMIDIEPAFRLQGDPLSLFPFRRFGHYNGRATASSLIRLSRRFASRLRSSHRPASEPLSLTGSSLVLCGKSVYVSMAYFSVLWCFVTIPGIWLAVLLAWSQASHREKQALATGSFGPVLRIKHAARETASRTMGTTRCRLPEKV